MWELHQIDGKGVYVSSVNIINVIYSALLICVDTVVIL